MFYIYIIKSDKDGSYYIGSCKDIKKRLAQHNCGLVKSTKKGVPWSLAYQEIYQELKDARRRELQIKSWKKRGAIERLIKHSKNLS